MNYSGTELALFQQATHWKHYWASRLIPLIHGDVLEVGAGIGSNTRLLLPKCNFHSWTLLEPDADLFQQLSDLKVTGHPCTLEHYLKLPSSGKVKKFDTILYLDVLEHISSDHQEIELVSKLLNPDGTLIVLAPAHQFLFSPFDQSIGHFRRYNKSSLRQLVPAPLFSEESLEYLDSLGTLASMLNRFLLRKHQPSTADILFWDRFLVPVSRTIDPLFQFSIGKTIIGVWKRR